MKEGEERNKEATVEILKRMSCLIVRSTSAFIKLEQPNIAYFQLHHNGLKQGNLTISKSNLPKIVIVVSAC